MVSVFDRIERVRFRIDNSKRIIAGVYYKTQDLISRFFMDDKVDAIYIQLEDSANDQ